MTDRSEPTIAVGDEVVRLGLTYPSGIVVGLPNGDEPVRVAWLGGSIGSVPRSQLRLVAKATYTEVQPPERPENAQEPTGDAAHRLAVVLENLESMRSSYRSYAPSPDRAVDGARRRFIAELSTVLDIAQEPPVPPERPEVTELREAVKEAIRRFAFLVDPSLQRVATAVEAVCALVRDVESPSAHSTSATSDARSDRTSPRQEQP